MITFIAIPKPFQGHIGVIQKNAIRSWTLLRPRPEIILMGDEKGTKEIAKKFNLRHVPNIGTNEYGTPLHSFLFSEGERLASNDWICQATSDIILTSEIVDAFEFIRQRLPRCLIVAKRWNVEINELIDFSAGWEEKLKSYVMTSGKREGHTGSDMFIFPKNLYGEIPPFSVGRAVFDNWFFYYTHSKGIPIVDITKKIFMIHQYHDYSHNVAGQKGIYTGIEAKRNMDLAGGYPHLFTLRDCDYELTNKGIEKKRKALFYRLYRWLVTYSGMYWLFSPVIKLMRRIMGRGSSFYR
jgi:hypothetical protein